jgi:hypothetical protein
MTDGLVVSRTVYNSDTNNTIPQDFYNYEDKVTVYLQGNNIKNFDDPYYVLGATSPNFVTITFPWIPEEATPWPGMANFPFGANDATIIVNTSISSVIGTPVPPPSNGSTNVRNARLLNESGFVNGDIRRQLAFTASSYFTASQGVPDASLNHPFCSFNTPYVKPEAQVNLYGIMNGASSYSALGTLFTCQISRNFASLQGAILPVTLTYDWCGTSIGAATGCP